MSAGWQLVLVAVAILVAAAFLGRRLWLQLTKSAKQPGCGSCSRNPASGNPLGEMVSLETLTSTAEKASTPPVKR